MKTCTRCKIEQPLSNFYKNSRHPDGLRSECLGCTRIDSGNKGVREYQLVINYFLILDRLRGATYGELAKRYRLDKSNIRKRIIGVLNAPKKEMRNENEVHRRFI